MGKKVKPVSLGGSGRRAGLLNDLRNKERS